MDGTTLPHYGIYKKQSKGTKLKKSISSAQNILPKTLSAALMTMKIVYINSLHGAVINRLVSYVEKHRVGTGTYRTCAGNSS